MRGYNRAAARRVADAQVQIELVDCESWSFLGLYAFEHIDEFDDDFDGDWWDEEPAHESLEIEDDDGGYYAHDDDSESFEDYTDFDEPYDLDHMDPLGI